MSVLPLSFICTLLDQAGPAAFRQEARSVKSTDSHTALNDIAVTVAQ